MSPEERHVVGHFERQRRLLAAVAAARALLCGAAVAGAGSALLSLIPRTAGIVVPTSLLLLAAVTVAAFLWLRRSLTLAAAARAIQLRGGDDDNILVTTEEMIRGALPPVHPVVRTELLRLADQRLRDMPPPPVRIAIVQGSVSLGATCAAIAAAFALASGGAVVPQPRPVAVAAEGLASRMALRVVVTPPPYTGARAIALDAPSEIDALEGSRIRIESPEKSPVTLVTTDARATPFLRSDQTQSVEITASDSRPLIVRSDDGPVHLIHLRVRPDQPPLVRVSEPARDLAFPEARGRIAVAIEARDDVGLAGLALRYTRVSGSGETFTFEEGEWPVHIVRQSASNWTARAELALEQLKLQDGDTLVYRATARDARPGADPASSETFLIDIGGLSGIASTGFALPEERDRHALSQQMLILKTERLHAQRRASSPDALIEQSRGLAVEQRRVKAEFVFMTGGEVEDEVEEAAHSHELAEGRLENVAQVEMLAAIREMSRAEARLNDGDTSEALRFERAALRALQRAFDRRRYFLRTLPERTRIDLDRRLTGDLSGTRSSRMVVAPGATDPLLEEVRDVSADLARAQSPAADVAFLAARMLAIDPAADALATAARGLVEARDEPARAAAIAAAQSALLHVARARRGGAARVDLTPAPLTGYLADELRRPGGSR